MSAFIRWFVVPVIGLGALLAGYTWLVLTWNYSEGERAGYVQKLSKKGWICKTWEGELALITMPGTVAEKFYFSVRSDAVAEQINVSIGKRVALTYEEHVGVPTTCFGETGHFIKGIKVIEDPAPIAPPTAPQPAAAPQPATPAVSSPPKQ